MTHKGVSGPLLVCLELLREGPSAIIWSFCKTGTIDTCERRGLIRDTGRRDHQTLRTFELTAAGHTALTHSPERREQGLWDEWGGAHVGRAL